MSVGLQDRANSYHKAFPNYPRLVADKGWLYGAWQIGNYYKRKHGFYGEYPPSYLKRVMSLFPEAKEVLHLFSGSLGKGSFENGVAYSTWDSDPANEAEFVLPVSELASYGSLGYDLILGDPPYNKKAEEIYSQPSINKRQVLRDCALILVPGGHLVWLDTIIPIYRKVDYTYVGQILLTMGTNRAVRVISIFERVG